MVVDFLHMTTSDSNTSWYRPSRHVEAVLHFLCSILYEY